MVVERPRWNNIRDGEMVKIFGDDVGKISVPNLIYARVVSGRDAEWQRAKPK